MNPGKGFKCVEVRKEIVRSVQQCAEEITMVVTQVRAKLESSVSVWVLEMSVQNVSPRATYGVYLEEVVLFSDSGGTSSTIGYGDQLVFVAAFVHQTTKEALLVLE